MDLPLPQGGNRGERTLHAPLVWALLAALACAAPATAAQPRAGSRSAANSSASDSNANLRWRAVQPVNYEDERPAARGWKAPATLVPQGTMRSVMARRAAIRTAQRDAFDSEPMDESLEPSGVGPFELPAEPAPARPFPRGPQAPFELGPDPQGSEPSPNDLPPVPPQASDEENFAEGSPISESCDDNGDCQDALDELSKSSIATIDLSIGVTGTPGEDYPCECVMRGDTFEPRSWESTIYTWKASALCHKPLYFENVAMERYGHSHGPILDAALAGAHFFAAIPILPYKMGLEPPTECIYTLGYYRPGSCAPHTIDPLPISPRGALLQAGAVVGINGIFP